ncbi:MAG: hypothetical protein SVK08_02980, partial [Halobacteriota archaeon]|nr:hypothetical protein [Halobacteriota archaeon]
KSWYTYKTIKGRWGIGKRFFNSKSYLAHWCGGEGYPYHCNYTQCGDCKTRVPKYIIKYCEENNVGI